MKKKKMMPDQTFEGWLSRRGACRSATWWVGSLLPPRYRWQRRRPRRSLRWVIQHAWLWCSYPEWMLWLLAELQLISGCNAATRDHRVIGACQPWDAPLCCRPWIGVTTDQLRDEFPVSLIASLVVERMRGEEN